MLFDKKITFDSFIRAVLAVLFVILLLYTVRSLSGVLLPFFVAWLMAYLIYPLVTFFQYRCRLKNRFISILAATLLALSVLVGAFILIVPPVVDELMNLKDLAQTYLFKEDIMVALPKAVDDFFTNYMDAGWVNEVLKAENLLQASHILLPKLGVVINTSYDLIRAVFNVFVTLLYFFFILLDYEKIANGWIHLLPQKYQPYAIQITTDLMVGMNKYFRGQALIAFIVGILFSIGFLIIDFPLAIGLGLFIGLLNMVPYLQIIGFIPTLLLAALKSAETGQNYWVVVGLALLVFAVVQVIQDAFLTPRIMGRVTGLNPAIILLSLSIWGSLMGVVGMIIALPMTTLLLSYYRNFIRKRNIHDGYQE